VISANFISLLPLLIIGAVTDLIGVPLVLTLLALGLLVTALASHLVGGREMPPAEPLWEHEREAAGVADSIDTPQGVR
jgi:hypothetical protein